MVPSLFVRARIAARIGPFVLASAMITGGAGIGGPAPAGSRAQASARLGMRVSIDFRGQTLREAVAYVADLAGLEAAPFWVEADGRPGLDPEAILTLRLRNATVREAVERILAAVPSEGDGEPTWQLSEAGALEVGPRSRLNSHHRVETYPIADLIRETPDFADAPTIDLSAALQADSGGTIFTEGTEGPPAAAPETAETPAERLVRLITTLIEAKEWQENGGRGASIHIFRDTLVIDAPEYIHRQIAGPGD